MAKPQDEWTTKYLAQLKKRGALIDMLPRSMASTDRAGHPDKSPEECADMRYEILLKAAADPEATPMVQTGSAAVAATAAPAVPATDGVLPTVKTDAQHLQDFVRQNIPSDRKRALPVMTKMQYSVFGKDFDTLREAADYAYLRQMEEFLGAVIDPETLINNADAIAELTQDYLTSVRES